MAIRAVVFDVGGVLELSADDYPDEAWAAGAGLSTEEFIERTQGIWAAGGTGEITLEEVHRQLREALGTDEDHVSAMMEDMWRGDPGGGETQPDRRGRAPAP